MKILILGVGNAQVDIIQLAQRLGMEVHACSYREEGPGLALVDRFVLLDLKDAESITDYCRDNAMDLVYSVGSDMAMPVISRVSETLGLPCFITEKAAALCQHKGAMRTALGPLFTGNIPFALGSSVEDLLPFDSYPAMLKPVDSQGQRGVIPVGSTAALRASFQEAMSHSRSGTVILERYIEGQEISLNGYLINGELVFSQLSDRFVYTEYKGGLVREHAIPSQFAATPGFQEKVSHVAEKALVRLGITNGPVYFQIKVTPTGVPYIIEITPRFDGCHMWRLIEATTKVNLLSVAMDHLRGLTIDKERLLPITALKGRLSFLSEKPGKPVDRAAFGALGSTATWYYDQGEQVRPINGQFEKVGYTITLEK